MLYYEHRNIPIWSLSPTIAIAYATSGGRKRNALVVLFDTTLYSVSATDEVSETRRAMNPHGVNNTLSALCTQDVRIWIGKRFLHSVIANQVSESIPVTVNHPDNASLGTNVGYLIQKGYRCKHDDETSSRYVFIVCGYTLVLQIRMKVRVVDFDDVEFDAKTKMVCYRSEAVDMTVINRFTNKVARLTFNPYLEVEDEAIWKPRQRALLAYIQNNWTLIDEHDEKVEFVVHMGGILVKRCVPVALNPELHWVALSSVRKEELTHESFLQEFQQLLVKYGMAVTTTK